MGQESQKSLLVTQTFGSKSDFCFRVANAFIFVALLIILCVECTRP